ncbi:DUF192 domain-containing protein [Thiorhodospira sibirica]|uniref:DUF192 domain-containing protein n=1 Tax=Thiorhodospira sibirica TaxID=154347 RepID=UPI00022C1122|nr:DUF192 domain-containing protein [Thiorhodospira sibirica]
MRWHCVERRHYLAVWLLLGYLGTAALYLHLARASESPSPLHGITLQIGEHRLFAELADTPQTRAQGLMWRTKLPPDHGMLFVWPEPMAVSMWMKNTVLPLSVAFIDAHGQIINIADMEPLTTTSHHASAPAQYALEMMQGWFAERGIGPGDAVYPLTTFTDSDDPLRHPAEMSWP